MLPDYPKTKALLSQAYVDRIESSQDFHLGIFTQIRLSIVHEGGSTHVQREDRSTRTISTKEIEAKIETSPAEILKMNFNEILKRLDLLGEQMAKEKGRLLLQCIEDAVSETGLVSDSSEDKVEQFLDLLIRKRIDFNRNGLIGDDQFIVGSREAAEKINEMMNRIQSTPSLNKRFWKIMDIKKREWRDREIDRNLVE